MRAANNLAFSGAVIDPADREFVGIRMFVTSNHLGDHDAFEFAAQLLNALHFDSEHGQTLGEFFRGPIEIDVLSEPVQGDFHTRTASETSDRFRRKGGYH